MEGEASNVLDRPCDENPNGSASATAGNHLSAMIQAQVEAIFNHHGRQAQLKGKRPCEDLVQNSSSASATNGTTRLLGTKAEWEDNAPSFDYDEGNARSFDYDEGRKVQVKRKRRCEYLDENPNGSASATAGNNLLGMIKDQVRAIFSYLGKKVQVDCEDLVWHPSSASTTARTTRCLGTKVKVDCEDLVRNPSSASAIARTTWFLGPKAEWEGRKAQMKRKRSCADLVENLSATAAASDTKAQVTGGPFINGQYADLRIYHPNAEVWHELEGGRLVKKIRNTPVYSRKTMLPIEGARVRPEMVLRDPYFISTGAVKVIGKHYLDKYC